jgi:hypothetical protein
MDTPSMSLPSPAQPRRRGRAANPPGFDREAFLKPLALDITAFVDKALT